MRTRRQGTELLGFSWVWHLEEGSFAAILSCSVAASQSGFSSVCIIPIGLIRHLRPILFLPTNWLVTQAAKAKVTVS